jgi:AhpD family alkylhydroperoxidase
VKPERRAYRGPGELARDLRALLRLHGQLLRLYLRPRIPRAFRERLMLTVTAVNACRYCAAFHCRTAGRLGVPHEEAALLLEGEVAAAPPREVPALLYARHWAEADARPDPAERARLLAGYAADEIAQVEAASASSASAT